MARKRDDGASSSTGGDGRKLLFLLPAALFAVLLVAFAIGLRHDPHLLPSALIDRPAPDFACRVFTRARTG